MSQQVDKMSLMYLSSNYFDIVDGLFNANNYSEYMFYTENNEDLKMLEVFIHDKYKTEIGYKRFYKLYQELKDKNFLVLMFKEIN